MFGRKKDETPQVSDAVGTSAEEAGGSQTGGKGRPTPTRKEAEAKNRRPLVINDRKAARAKQRAANTEARVAMDQAMRTGDERHMPAQHRGPQRRFIRDYVDARWSLGEFFLPIAMVFLLLTFIWGNQPQWALPLLLLLYGIILIALIDAVLLGRRIKKILTEKYGAENLQRGLVMYAVLRAFQLRATRMPKPQVKRGDYPTA